MHTNPDMLSHAVTPGDYQTLLEYGQTYLTVDNYRQARECYEQAAVLADDAITAQVEQFVADTAAWARVATLTTKLVQLTLPGVPDIYQGCELVDLSLVDPDNRRAVDYQARAHRLAALDAGDPPQGLSDEKLRVTAAAVRTRREHPEWFGFTDVVEHPGPFRWAPALERVWFAPEVGDVYHEALLAALVTESLGFSSNLITEIQVCICRHHVLLIDMKSFLSLTLNPTGSPYSTGAGTSATRQAELLCEVYGMPSHTNSCWRTTPRKRHPSASFGRNHLTSLPVPYGEP